MFFNICILNLLQLILFNINWSMALNEDNCFEFLFCECELGSQPIQYICNINNRSSEFFTVKAGMHSLEILCNGDKEDEEIKPNIIHDFISILNEKDNVEVIFNSCLMPLSQIINMIKGIKVTSLKLIASPSQIEYSGFEEDMKDKIFLRKFFLKRTSLLTIPKRLFAKIGEHLELIDLSGNSLAEIPNMSFNSTPYLKELNLGGNKLTVLRDPLGYLIKLETLYLHNNELISLTQEVFQGTPNIINLDLQGNKFKTLLEDTFFLLENLRVLNLFSTNLQILPEAIFRQNVNLLKLDLHDNPFLYELPANLFKTVKHINHITLSQCNLTTLPEIFFNSLPHLKKVEIHSNKLMKLDGKLFNNCSLLESIDLHNNKLTEISNHLLLGKTNLTFIDLSYNRLKSLSADFFVNMKLLSELNLSHNNLTEVSNFLQHLNQLEKLYLQNNKITTIDVNIFSQFYKLRMLHLSNNQLSSANFLPPHSLEYINLSFNNLDGIPFNWQQLLQKLKVLDLSHNKIKVVSAPNLQFFSSEAIINLEYNKIKIIDLSDNFEVKPNSNNVPLIKLNHNPLHCDCRVQFLIEYLAYQISGHNNIWFRLDVNELLCASPSIMRNKSAISLDTKKLMCSEFSNCPSFCACTRNAKQTERIISCVNVRLQKIPLFVPPQMTTLDLTGNFIRSLDGLEDPIWDNLTNLILSENHLELINASYLPKNLKKLAINHNNLKQISPHDLEILSHYDIKELKLGFNPWNCECDDLHFQEWLDQEGNIVVDWPEMMCSNIPNETVSRYTCTKPYDFPRLLIGLSLAAALLSVFLCMSGIAYYKYLYEIRVWLYSKKCCLQLISEEDGDSGKVFDAFVSFSQDDVDWVIKELIPELEQREPYYRLCVHYRDWIVGEWIPDQIVRSVEASCRTIVILSQNFIRSIWGKWEFKTAHHQALKDSMNRVIVIVLGDIPPKEEMDPEMRMYVDFNTYLRWGDPWFWKKLRYAMPHRTNSHNALISRNRKYWTSPRVTLQSL